MDATDLAFAGAAAAGPTDRRRRGVVARARARPTSTGSRRLDPQLNAYRSCSPSARWPRPTRPTRAAAPATSGRCSACRSRSRTTSTSRGEVDRMGHRRARRARAAGRRGRAPAARRRARSSLGKTNVPEMTIWPFTETITFGATRNPWDVERTPGGSSAAAAARRSRPGMVGRRPGLRRRWARSASRRRGAACSASSRSATASRSRPHDDAWQGLSVNGPIARTVADAALFLDATTRRRRLRSPRPQREPGRLRIAVSTEARAGTLARISAPTCGAARRAHARAAALARATR